uniref:Ribosomal protein L37 n=1 Tax=Anopheles coluzzii TaxID=1518534 RepID=A0A6E8W2V4_ANOCL|nr:uncharacterized protein LOC120955584 [Anopheles coluzzii]
MTKGTSSFGQWRNKSHTLCNRCGKRSYHTQKKRCASCNFPAAKMRSFNWSKKAISKRTTGAGRLRYLKHVRRCMRNGVNARTAK